MGVRMPTVKGPGYHSHDGPDLNQTALCPSRFVLYAMLGNHHSIDAKANHSMHVATAPPTSPKCAQQ